MWWSILKVQESITDLGLDFESPDEKLEPKDKDCCEIAKNAYKIVYVELGNWAIDYEGTFGIKDSSNLLDVYNQLVENNVFTDAIDTSSCEDFKEMLKIPMKYPTWKPEIVRILDEWEECENE